MVKQSKIAVPCTIALPTLAKALKLLARNSDKRSTIPILSHVLLINDGSQLSLHTTDLDNDLSITVPSSGDPYRTTTPAAKLRDFLASMVGEHVALSMAENARLRIEGDGASASLTTLPADDFPLTKSVEFDKRATFDAAALAANLAFVSPAISTEETRYYLNGIFFHPKDDGLRLVATDGHRLHAATVAACDVPEVIVPHRAINLVRALIAASKDAETVELAFAGKARMQARVGDWTLNSKLIDGVFPDYARVIPTANDKVLHAGSRELVAAAGAATAIASEKTRAVKLTRRDGELLMTCRSPENGEGEASVRGSDASALDFEIGFNAGYLKAVGKAMSPAHLSLALANSAAPALITSPDAAGRLVVLMPMRV